MCQCSLPACRPSGWRPRLKTAGGTVMKIKSYGSLQTDLVSPVRDVTWLMETRNWFIWIFFERDRSATGTKLLYLSLLFTALMNHCAFCLSLWIMVSVLCVKFSNSVEPSPLEVNSCWASQIPCFFFFLIHKTCSYITMFFQSSSWGDCLYQLRIINCYSYFSNSICVSHPFAAMICARIMT